MSERRGHGVPRGPEPPLTAEEVLTNLSGDDSHHVVWGEVALRVRREQDDLRMMTSGCDGGGRSCTHPLSFVSFRADGAL